MELDRKRVGFVREMARKYLKKYGVKTAGTPVEKIIKAEGLRIELRPWGSDGLSGLMLQKARVIAINVNKSHHHQRFSLAHEFGHWTLNHDYFKTLGFGLVDINHAPDATTHPNDKVIEQEADEFAGELLVPMQILKQVYRSETNYANLGNIFDVSREVILISLMKHHLIR